jgi:hypothetical protein
MSATGASVPWRFVLRLYDAVYTADIRLTFVATGFPWFFIFNSHEISALKKAKVRKK